MNANALVMLDLTHAALLALRQASEEGRDVTDAEVQAVRDKLSADIDRVQAKINAMGEK